MIDKIAWLHIENGRILSTRSRGKNAYYLPGGKREGDESDIQTLIREIKEELSADIVASSAKLYGIFEAQAHGKSEGIVVRMTCYTADFEGELIPDNEIEEMKWLTTADMDSISPVDKLIFSDLKSKGLLD